MNKVSIDALRNLMGEVNRRKMPASDLDVKVITDKFSPPFKGDEPAPKDYNYPSQLSGVKNDKKQQVNLSGSTNGQSQFGGTSGSFGSPTGGSYAT